jgi:hypothetical protein
MDKSVSIVIVLGVLAALLGLMAIGWRARKVRQRDVSAPLAVPTDVGSTLTISTGKYVATTVSGDPLNRIAVHGLGFRGAATVVVASSGLVVTITGRDDFWIPASDVRDIRRATWTIDRVVEPDGLTLIEWMLGAQSVGSYFRLDDPAAFEQAARTLSSTERHDS